MELAFQNLTKSYGSKRVLRGISMTLTEGIYGVLGPNGAGKSTMMNILTGNLKQDSGQILFDGQEIGHLGIRFRARMGYMPQQQAFYPGFSAEQFLFYIASLRGMDKAYARERIDWSLDLLGLTAVRKKRVRSLSGGMKQRLLLAQAILADPDVLVLDEPTAGLDPMQRIAVRNLIAEISLHKIVIISTHVVPDVEFVSKEILLLSEGTILRKGSAQELIRELEGMVWEIPVEEEQVKEMRREGTVSGVYRAGEQIMVRLISPSCPVSGGTVVTPTLEDTYLYHFGEARLE